MEVRNKHEYNTIISFQLKEELIFPDFSIRHIKHEKKKGPNNGKWEKQAFYFSVEENGKSQEIVWRTGRTQNTKFTVDDIVYELAMGSYQVPNAKVKSFKSLKLNQLLVLRF